MVVEILESAGRVRLSRSQEHLIVMRQWHGPRHVFAAILALVLCTIAGATFINAGGWYVSRTPPWALAMFGVGVLYYALTGFNRTTIRINSDGVEIRRGPLPVLGKRSRHISFVHSIAVRHDKIVTMRGGVGEVYVVEGVDSNGQPVVLDLVPDASTAKAMVRLLRRAQLVGSGVE